MKLGNILAATTIIVGFIGILMLPLWNLTELPYAGDTGFAKGGGWILMAQSGVFKWPALFLVITGGALFGVAKMLPKRFWKTAEDLFDEKIEAGRKGRTKSRNNV